MTMNAYGAPVHEADVDELGGTDLVDDKYFDGPKDDNFKVVIRVRPPLPRELDGWKPFQNTVHIDSAHKAITLSENLPAYGQNPNGVSEGLLYATYRFTFDHVYGTESQQDEVYATSAQPVVLSTLQGYNAAIIAYGQTGTGKTFTMEGDISSQSRGIVPRAIGDIFQCISRDMGPHSQYLVRASYLQIYNECISDLLKTERTNLIIREDRRRGVYVDGLSEWVVRSQSEIMELMARGAENRTTGATKLNDVSSRSHAVFIVIVEHSQSNQAKQPDDVDLRGNGADLDDSVGPDQPVTIKVGKLNLVDLAGSERVHITGATGKRLEESKKINQSLSALGNVIAALTDNRSRQHIPYRDSKLTRILEDSLGGNCKTTMMCMISPALEAFAESVSTLKFANRAKNIRNRAQVNEDLDHRTLLRKYEKELKRLRSELQRRSKLLVDKRHLLQIEEQRRRAEADKLAAITELEHRSKEFMKEKSEKRILEEKIAALQGQLLVGGRGIEETPQFRSMLAREQRRIRSEYEDRLKELERERNAVEDDRAQVDRYKQLLLKQRDIMLALTKRLNDRDEQILTLQEELDAYDKYQRKLEDALDERTAELIALRKAAMEHANSSPTKNSQLQNALDAWGDGPRASLGSPRIGVLRDDAAAAGGGATPLSEVAPRSPRSASDSDDTAATSSVVEAQRAEIERLQALLAERRDGAGGGRGTPDGALRQVAALQDENSRLRALLNDVGRAGERDSEERVARLQSENERLRQHIRDTDAEVSREELSRAAMVEQISNHTKERAALKTILDSKIRLLVSEILKGLGEMDGAGAPTPPRLVRQATALSKLVAATVNAMAPSPE